MSGDGNWKTKLREAIKIDNGLKSIVSIVDAEEKTNQALISTLPASKSEHTTPSLIVTPTTHSSTDAASSADFNQSTTIIATLAQSYPATSVKLNSILRK